MKNQYVTWLMRALTVGLASSAIAVPADLSVEAYKAWQVQAQQQTESEVNADFSEREADMETLAKPFKVGEQVEIVLKQGNRVRQIRGKFRDIEGTTAEIGESKYLLKDIRQVDADRLRFGKHPELLQLKLDQMRRELELEKNKMRELRLEQKRREAGYTNDFFESSVELGGRYWSYRDLGKGQVEVLARAVGNEPFIEVAIVNRSGTDNATLAILGKTPVACTIKTTPDVLPEYSQEAWSQFRFRISRDTLGSNPWKTLEKDLKLWTVRENTGSWQFVLREDSARAGTARFRTHMPPLRIKNHTPANLRHMRKYAQAAAAYQESIATALAEKRASIAAAEQADREEKLAKEAEMERLRAEREAAVVARKKAEEPYVWLTVEEAKQLAAGTRIDRRVLTDDTYDDVNYPSKTTIDEKDYYVLKFTDWEKRKAKIPPRDPLALFEIISVRYRILRLMHFDTYEKKMKRLEEANAVPDTPETAATDAGYLPDEEFFNEYDQPPPGFRRSPGRLPAPVPSPRATAADTDEEPTEKTLVQLLEEIHEDDDVDTRPDPGYLLQYRVQYQNRLSKTTEFVTMITATTPGDDVTWEDAYVAEGQYLGPLYGSYRLSLEQLATGIDSLAVAVKIEGAEEERERLEKERLKQIEMAKQNKLIKALPKTDNKNPDNEYGDTPSLFD